MHRSVRYIKARTPKVFLLENVPSLRSRKKFRKGYTMILRKLRAAGYKLFIKNLCTGDHGLPQQRVRTYIAGVRDDFMNKKKGCMFRFPAKLKHGPLHPRKLLGPASPKMAKKLSVTFKRNLKRAVRGCKEAEVDPKTSYVFVDVDAGKKFSQWKLDMLPCLTASRGATGFFCTKLKRRLTPKESLRFQGLTIRKREWEKHGLSGAMVGKAAGNAMSANILMRVLPRLLHAAGLCGTVSDPWERAGYNPFKA